MGNANSDLTPASVQGESTSGQHQQPSTLPPSGNLTQNARNPDRSPDTSAGTTASATVAATDRDPQPAPAQDAGTSGEHHQLNTLAPAGHIMQNGADHNRSPDASAETTAYAMVVATEQDPQPAPEQESGTSGEHPQLNTLAPAGNIIQNGADHNRSADTSAGTTASATVAATDRDQQPAPAQDAGTSGEHPQLTALAPAGHIVQNGADQNRAPDASAGTTASAMVAATEQDPQPAPEQESGTSAEGQTPAMENPTQFECSICLGTDFRQDQLKRMRCNHVFHQSCLDLWLNNNRNCPLCRNPYRRLPRKRRSRAKKRPLATRGPL